MGGLAMLNTLATTAIVVPVVWVPFLFGGGLVIWLIQTANERRRQAETARRNDELATRARDTGTADDAPGDW